MAVKKKTSSAAVNRSGKTGRYGRVAKEPDRAKMRVASRDSLKAMQEATEIYSGALKRLAER